MLSGKSPPPEHIMYIYIMYIEKIKLNKAISMIHGKSPPPELTLEKIKSNNY